VAFHYPPFVGSSGVHRTLTFSRYLPDAGWDPIVLSAHPRAFEGSDPQQLKDIPAGIPVSRAFALDTKRHLAVRGAFPRFLALPDRWVSWVLGAVPSGLRLVRRHRPSVIWTTYPVATAHLIGYFLHRLTGLPWVADYRDTMTEEAYPADPKVFRCYRWIEQRAVRRAAISVFTTPGAVRMYRERYPDVERERFALLPNGFDEAAFQEAEQDLPARQPGGPLTLVHSGVLYPSERDPRQFFDALVRLKEEGVVSARDLRIVLRAAGHEDVHAAEIARRGLADVVDLAPALRYRDALREMLVADGLLLFQASNCNHQVPAKVYEYFRARRPIFGMTDPAGDTAGVLRDAGIDTIAPLDDAGAIARGFAAFLAGVREGTAPIVERGEIARHSRRGRTDEFARLLSVAAGLREPQPAPAG